jgi:membrane fusion protein, copper/silver efflux system
MTPAKIAAITFIAAGIFFAGYMANRQAIPSATSADVGQARSYGCPMHPQYKSDHAGECPICGMRLELESGDGSNKSEMKAHELPGTVEVMSEKQQLIGVRTDEVQKTPALSSLRVPGRIAVDEQRQYRIVAATDGWIREMGNNPAGSSVKKGEVLASYYAENLTVAVQNYFFALQTTGVGQTGDTKAMYQLGTRILPLQTALDALRTLGLSEFQIAEIEKTRQAPPAVRVYCPINGFVIARNVSPEQRFDKGTELYRIADISHVWVLSDIFEKDIEYFKPGAIATVHYQGREFQARMSNALPQFDPQTRTLKTRFELENPGIILRPDMFVDVQLHFDMPAAIAVPADSVIDLGDRKLVYIARGETRFEPRIVQTGWRLGGKVQITGGLDLGERIVTSSNFLVDSESRMRLAGTNPAEKAAVAINPVQKVSEKKPATVKDVVCGMEVDPGAPGALKARYKDKDYYFCGEHCKKSFEAGPEKYVHQGMAAQDMQHAGMQHD